MTNSRIDSVTRQLDGPQLVVRKERVAKRVHTVPSTLTQQMRAEIAEAVSYGRSIPQTAKEYNCVQIVVTEIWLRAELAKLRGAALRRVA